jgi:hypothetical protein
MSVFDKFISWFQGMGGRVPSNMEEVFNDRYVYDVKPISSFIGREEYIKRKYNHRFKHRAPDLEQYPDVNKIKFEKK